MRELLKKVTPRFVLSFKRYIDKRYYRHHSQSFSVARELSKSTGIPYLALLFDINLSILKLVTPTDYTTYLFHEKSHFSRDQFLTTHRMSSLARSFNPEKYRPLFDNKDDFNRFFSDFIGRQWLYAPDASDERIEDFLLEQQTIFVKPFNLRCGVGARKIQSSDVTDVKAFCESARKDRLMLEEVVKQHPDLSSVNPASVNTLRINTVLDKAGIPHILSAVIRMGRGESVVDNLACGGIVAQIDLDEGVLFTLGIGGDLQTYVKHPSTGVILPGLRIPHWEAAKNMVLHVAGMSPQIRWVGWDVAVTENGPLLIEGNMRPDTRLIQLASQRGIYHTLRRYL